MSTRVYLSREISVLPDQEDTPVSIRIPGSSATVKALHTKLQQAYLKDDRRLGRRTTVLIEMLVHHVPIPVLCERWSLRASWLYDWQRTFLLHGLDSLVSRHSGGRRPQGTPRQKKRLGERLEAGPLVVGCATACWDAVRIRGLIWREFGVLSNRQYVCPLLHNWGVLFTRPGWCRIISTRPRASPGWSRSGRRWYGRRRVARGASCVKMRPAWRRGVPCVTRGHAVAGSRRCPRVASAQALQSLARWPLALGVSSLRVLRAGFPRTVPTHFYRWFWLTPRSLCF